MARGGFTFYALYLWNDDDYCVGVFTSKELAEEKRVKVGTIHDEILKSKKKNRPFRLNNQEVRVYVYREEAKEKPKKQPRKKRNAETEKAIREYRKMYLERRRKESEEEQK